MHIKHGEAKAHLRSGHMHHIKPFELPGGEHEKSEVETTDILKSDEQVVGYEPTIGDRITDLGSRTFILKSVDRGMFTIERDGRTVAAMNERDYRRFVAAPGTILR